MYEGGPGILACRRGIWVRDGDRARTYQFACTRRPRTGVPLRRDHDNLVEADPNDFVLEHQSRFYEPRYWSPTCEPNGIGRCARIQDLACCQIRSAEGESHCVTAVLPVRVRHVLRDIGQRCRCEYQRCVNAAGLRPRTRSGAEHRNDDREHHRCCVFEIKSISVISATIWH